MIQPDLFDSKFDAPMPPKKKQPKRTPEQAARVDSMWQRATKARDDGIKRAIDHAELEQPKWGNAAYAFVELFAKEGKPFRAEQVRLHAHEVGLAPPPDGRAWGAVFMRASRNGLIERVGFEPCTDPKSHNAPVSVWARKGFFTPS